MKRNWMWAAGTLLIVAVIAAVLIGPVPQDPAYHDFADQRRLLGIPHSLDVLSNIGFLFVGIWGLVFLANSSPEDFLSRGERWCYLFFFLGVTLTALGSSYYHLAPNNARLVWDRLPMAMGFMALLAAVLGERVRPSLASRSVGPFMVVGIGSVLFWRWTEIAGRGDLRPYGIVQFGSLLVVLLACASLPSGYTHGGDMFLVIALYALAKLFEALDRQVFYVSRIVSGHTLKHVAAALACLWVLRMLMRRQPRTAIAE